MYGKDFAYANTRIQNSVVRILKTGDPVIVNIVGVNGACSVTNVEDLDNRDLDGDNKSFVCHLDDLNLEPVPLGYVNNGGVAIYLQRIPVRRGPGNQGLTTNNCVSSGERLFRFPNKSLKQCILGKYPLFEKALEESRALTKVGKQKIIAFNRYWAVGGDVLFYKNHLAVGYIKDSKPVLSSQYTYLKEALSELV